MKYIDADKLVAEIERLKEEYGSLIPKSLIAQNYQEGRLIGYEDVLYVIKKSIQQKVDLEKEVRNYKVPFNDCGWERLTYNTLKEIAYHFYELGRNARKDK